MDVSVVGAGRVGTAMAALLARSGHTLRAVAGGGGTRERAARYLPHARVLEREDAAAAAELVLIGTPDAAIEPTCTALARAGVLGPGKAVAHLSGAIGLDALGAAEEAGATILSLHPLQTCPDVDAAVARLPGSAFAVTARSAEGFELGRRLAMDVGGRPFRLVDEMKPLYHAAAVFASNYLVVLSAQAESLGRAAGLEDPRAALEPLQRATLDNVAALGPARALTGPAVRGDAVTVEANLRALAEHAPEAVPAYVALARLGLELATAAERLVPRSRRAVEEVLDRWT